MTALDDITATDPNPNGQPSDVSRDELRDDIANADRYAAEHADRLRHVTGFVPPWRVWDGTRWAADETGEHMEAAKRTADRLLEAARTPATSSGRSTRPRHGAPDGSARW